MTDALPQKPDQPVTLQTIADRAHVTRALVSLAMRNSPKVAQGTRLRIHAIAEELGYKPNPMVRALMSHVRRGRQVHYKATLAFLTNLRGPDYWRTLHTYPDYFNGATDRAATLGYNVEHFWLPEYRDNPSRFVKVLQARGIPGILVAPLPQRGGSSLPVDLSGFSVATFGYSLASPSLPRICNHHLQTIEDAIGHLIQRGYREIGIALAGLDIRQVNYLWMAGLDIARRKNPGITFHVFEPKVWSEPAFRRWFHRCKPDALIGVTMETWQWTLNLGLDIPRDLGFLHLDCRRDDFLSGMFQRTYRLGQIAVEMLVALVEENIQLSDEESRILLLNSEFHEGETLRPILTS